MKQAFQLGEKLAVSGRVRFYKGLQIAHPEYDRLVDEGDVALFHTGRIIPLYPTTRELIEQGLDSRGLRRLIRQALEEYSAHIGENLPSEVLERHGLISRREALNAIHFPLDSGHLEQARRRLKFEELFFLELMMAYRRRLHRVQEKGVALSKVGHQTRGLVQRLPFELTEAQKRVLRQIWEDMKRETPMNRLLQGDVGSGKTIVALVAMVLAVDNGFQAALMAPTEILAEQHYITFRKLLEDMGVPVACLIGGMPSSRKREILEGLEAGKISIVVGTHALIQEKVQFKNLGLVVIDEQHRFGVMQRARLREKGWNPNVLVMTATPIPRTLALTVYGDLDVSVLDEKPVGRQAVVTVWRREDKRREIYQFVAEQIARGKQAYIVFPLVEESEKVDLKAATESYERLRREVFTDGSIALLHGRMKPEEKEQIMEAFKEGRIKVLVCTTVIEVGVDVPQASIMVIEHAERYGLPQLHQLRGRVGRGAEKSYCILISARRITEEAQRRLETLVRTTDGFEISEEDLKLRGPGEFFGLRQHGFPRLKIADLVTDTDILLDAREAAFDLVAQDAPLKQGDHLFTRQFFIDHYRDRFRLIKVG